MKDFLRGCGKGRSFEEEVAIRVLASVAAKKCYITSHYVIGSQWCGPEWWIRIWTHTHARSHKQNNTHTHSHTDQIYQMTVSMLAGALPGCHHLTVMYTHTKHTLCSAQQLAQKKCFFRCEWSFLVEHNTPPVSCWVCLSHLSLLKVEAGRKTRTG